MNVIMMLLPGMIFTGIGILMVMSEMEETNENKRNR